MRLDCSMRIFWLFTARFLCIGHTLLWNPRIRRVSHSGNSIGSGLLRHSTNCIFGRSFPGLNRISCPLFSTTTPESSSTFSNRTEGGPRNFRKNNGRGKKKVFKHKSIKSMFRSAKTMERQGKWKEASQMFQKILDQAPRDAHSHLALARLEARREQKPRIKRPDGGSKEENPYLDTDSQSKAQIAFATGTASCPESVHLWQAWAVYEASRGNYNRARELFQEALTLEPENSYVCHAFGLMEKKLGNESKATNLFHRALKEHSTAALVCSLGEIQIANGDFEMARDLYALHLPRLEKEKDRIEVYLASAWLEERYFQNYERAQEVLQCALDLSPGSSLANVALARLEGRMQRRNSKIDLSGDIATAKRLSDVCQNIEKGDQLPSDPTDGRVFTALANLEVKARRFKIAREVLRRGTELYPLDHNVSILPLPANAC